ncbi:MAG TPA: RagB/SusD family nutrient uptake outer membrane protein [Gemmatimonadaceae bacterium]|nr:RagB/SusD family nutrient uptake outer membrane protein [Gemmatimonadaceae bacterium]
MRFIHNIGRIARGAARVAGLSVLGVAAATFMVACDTHKMLSVESPNSVPVALFDAPENAVLMANSAIGDFECGFGSFVLVEGLISDDLADATLTAAAWPLDRRDANTQTNGTYGTGGCTATNTPGVYTPLSTARWEADQALTKLNGWTDAQVPTRTSLIAQMNLYSGLSYTTLGMSMCQAAFDLGPAVDQKGMFALAEKRFTDAITAGTAGSLTAIVNAALVGRARVRLYQGNTAGAIADATLVPKGFVLNVVTGANDTRRYNHVYLATEQLGNLTVEKLSLTLKTENDELDPRSAVTQTTQKAADSQSLIYVPTKFGTGPTPNNALGEGIPTPVARYEEAQLILAEAQGGSAAVTIINAMRAAVSLKPYTGATDATSIKNLVIDERRRVLFAEGFRNYDIQRFGIAPNPAVGAAYPRVGGTYGTTVCLPLPDVERINNPNIGT